MFEHINQRVIKNLMEEIECLSASELELVGHNAISIKEFKKLIHRGINKDYKPVKCTVDSYSDDSKLIVEYSTDANFFKDSAKKDDPPYFEKPEKDIKHAIDHCHPIIPKKICLISSQEEPPSFRANFNKIKIFEDNIDKVEILDSRELAKLIYKQSIDSADNASFYKQFFPGFSQHLDNYEYYGKIPSFSENHISDLTILNSLKKQFNDGKKLCVLHGVSGSGKTQLAIDFVHSNSKDFENYLWISGEDWKKGTSLSSIQRTRGGAAVNVAGLFNTSKTILVIDDYNNTLSLAELSELEKGFENGGIVVVTSQIGSPGDKHYLPIPTLPDKTAMQVLGEDPINPSKRCNEIVTLCKFSPLILSTIRNLVEKGNINRDDLYKEVLDCPKDVTDSEGKSIIGKILNKLEPSLLQSLKKVSNAGSTLYDADFLKDFIGLLKRNDLQKFSILLPSNVPGILKIHDLICSAVQDNPNSHEISLAVGKSIQQNDASMSPSILRQIHLSLPQLTEEYNTRKTTDADELAYALLQINGEMRKKIQEDFHSKTITKDLGLAAIRCIIDSKEAHSFLIENLEDRNLYNENCIKEYQTAIDAADNNEIKKELLHHLGKIQRRVGLHDESLVSFEKVVTLDEHMHATYLQIAHLGSQKGVSSNIKKSGDKYMRILLDSIFKNPYEVPLRVSLGSLARLRSYSTIGKTVSSNPDEVKCLANILALSAFEKFDQFFEAFVSFTSLFGYDHGALCVEIIENFPEILSVSPETVEEQNWIHACEGLTNLAIAAGKEGKTKLAQNVTKIILLFADKKLEGKELKSFDARAIGKAYLFANQHKKALEAFEKVPKKSQDHWLLYRKAEAQLLGSDNATAYITAKEAYDLATKDAVGLERISIYHSLLSQCADRTGDKEEAIREARLALDKCNNPKYRIELEAKCLELENK